MKRTILYIILITDVFLISCTNNAVFNIPTHTVVKPASISVTNPFTEAVTYFAIHNSNLYAGTKISGGGTEVYRYSGSNMVLVFSEVNTNYKYVSSMCSFNGKLYIGLYNASTGAELRRTVDDTVYPHTWETVETATVPYNSVGAMIEYQSRLVIGLSSFDTGGNEKVILLHSATGDSGSFISLSNDGPNLWGLHNNEVANFYIYNNDLYIATIKDKSVFGDGAELYKYTGIPEAGSLIGLVDADTSSPVRYGGMGPIGTSYSTNMGFPSFVESGAYFYIGVKNIVQDGTGVTPNTGCKIWRTSDTGATAAYQEVVDNGFGDVNNISVDSMIVFHGYIYALTRNYTTGSELWRSSTGNSGTWVKRNSDGFGDSANVSGRAVIIHNGVLYIGLDRSTAGATILQYGAAP